MIDAAAVTQLADELHMKARLEAALPTLLRHARVDSHVLLIVKDDLPDKRRDLEAWTYPSESMGEGPGGWISIAFRRSTLTSSDWPRLLRILAHEVGHAAVDMDKVKRGGRVKCDLAEAIAGKLLTAAADELRGLGD